MSPICGQLLSIGRCVKIVSSERGRTMKNIKRKCYSEAFKKEAVMRVMGQNSSTHKVSRDLGVSQASLSKWGKKFKQEGSSVFGKEETEIKKLRSKVKRLQDERDILKTAVSFFAKHEG